MIPVRPRMLETGLGFCLLASVLFFGGVYSWVLMPVCAVLFLMSAVHFESFFSLPVPAILKTLIFFLLLGLLIQSLFSLSPHSVRIETLKWTAFWCAFFLSLSLSRDGVFRVLGVMGAAAFLETLYAFFQVYGGSEKILWQMKETHLGWLTGTYFNRNHLAGFLELSLGPILSLGLAEINIGNKKKAGVFALAFGVILAGLCLTGSRMGFFSFFLSTLILGFYSFKRYGRSGLLLPAAVSVFIILITLTAWPVFSARLESLSNGNFDGGRVQIWKSTLVMIGDYLWQGIGPGAYRWVFPAYQPAKFTLGWPHAHQDYLELFASLGLPLFLLLASIFTFYTVLFFKRWNRLDRADFFQVLGPAVSLLSFLIHGFGDFNFAIPANMLAFSILAGVSFRLVSPKDFALTKAPARGVREAVYAAAFGLCFLCAGQAWAGWNLYRAEPLYAGGRHEAVSFLERSLRFDPHNPRALYLAGQVYYLEGVKTGNPEALKKGEGFFERMTRETPRSGKAWMGLALVRLDLAEKGNISKETWDLKIKPLLDRGYREEPGNTWVAYNSARALISQWDYLTALEKKEALMRMRRSLSIRDPQQASPHLKFALEFLWKQFADFSVLKSVMPQDPYSYEVLMGFIEEKGLWNIRHAVEADYFSRNQNLYHQLCVKGKQLLAGKKFARAYEVFDRAYGRNNVLMAAAAGRLAAQAGANALPSNFKGTLIEILEQEDEKEAWDYLPFMEDKILDQKDPYLTGLYLLRSGKIEQSCLRLEKTERDADHPRIRYFLAEACEASGNSKKAADALAPVLKEDQPDLRELLLLAKIDSPFRGEAVQKAELYQTGKIEPREWWNGSGISASGLALKGRLRVQVNLKPGPVIFHLKAVSTLVRGNGAYLQADLWEGERVRRLGHAYMPSEAVREMTFSSQTSGGKRWFEIELMNGSRSPSEAGPVLQLREMTVEYPS